MPAKTHKRGKFSRWRGNWSHGWGAKKKHRGSGHRGGAGMGSRGKRGASKGPLVRYKKEYFGKFGFKTKNQVPVRTVTVQYLEEKADRLAAAGKITLKNGTYSIDLKTLGFDKLLSKGAVRKKFDITVVSATPHAVKKIEKVGGAVHMAKEE